VPRSLSLSLSLSLERVMTREGSELLIFGEFAVLAIPSHVKEIQF
jgi:hypothetical protein